MAGNVIVADDGAGNTFELFEADGITFPRYFTDDVNKRLQDVRDMPGRDDDVIIAAYPKAGTHWVWEITNMLLQGTAEYHSSMKEAQMLELTGTKGTEELTSPRVFNSHLRFRHLPKDMISRNCKLIYIERNPKDMAVSRYVHNSKGSVGYKGSFSNYLRLYMGGKVAFGSWFDYTRNWEADIAENKGYPIHRVCYEKLKQDPAGEVRKLATFLDVSFSDQLINDICEKCNFSNLRSSYENQKKLHDEKEVNPLNYTFRKGTVGDWKNWFTVAENEAFDAALATELQGLNKTYIYE